MEHVTTKNEFDSLIKSGLALVDFYADWCGPCRMLAPVLVELEKDLNGKAKIIKVNVDEADEVSSTFGIRNIPTLMLFKDGVMVEKVVGFASKDALKNLVNRHL